jgi:hypothetical protein
VGAQGGELAARGLEGGAARTLQAVSAGTDEHSGVASYSPDIPHSLRTS